MSSDRVFQTRGPATVKACGYQLLTADYLF